MLFKAMEKKIAVLIILLNLVFFSFGLTQESFSASELLSLHKQALYNHALKKTEQSAANGQSSFDAKYYKLELEIHFNPDILTGKVSGRFQSRINNLNELQLDFDNGLTVLNVSGAANNFDHVNQMLTLTLDRTYLMDEIIDVTIEYSGTPDQTTQRWIVFDELADGSDHLWTLSEPYGARYWWPCKDTPNDKADSVDIIVTAPGNQIVASNGSLLSQVDNNNGTKTWHWHEKYPIATYLVSLAIAPYAHFTDMYVSSENTEMLLDYYVYPDREADAMFIFPELKDYMDAMVHYFGPYPFDDEKYGMAQFGGRGGMEHQTLTSIGQVNSQWRYLYVHELGHQWFGDAVTCASWRDIWLNEGFASYTEALYAEWAGYSDLPPGMDSYHTYINGQEFKEPGTIIIEDTTDYQNIFNRIVYDKGSWVLHMLRHVMDEQDFFTALYEYVNHPQFKYSSVNTEDFKKVCEDVSGLQLEAFFDQWLNYPFFPKYVYKWEKIDSPPDGLFRIKVTISQEPADVIYEMPIDLRFSFFNGPDTTIKVWNNQQDQTYTFALNKLPQRMLFDPDNWILKNAREISSTPFTKEIIVKNIYPNPATSEINIVVQSWLQGRMSAEIVDLNGRQVAILKPYFSSGVQEYFFKWNRNNSYGNPVASGIYFIRAKQNGKISKKAKKMVIL